jgi:hypothetical protein
MRDLGNSEGADSEVDRFKQRKVAAGGENDSWSAAVS